MNYPALSSLFVAVDDLAAVIAVYNRLGLRVEAIDASSAGLRIGTETQGFTLMFVTPSALLLGAAARKARAAARGAFAIGLHGRPPGSSLVTFAYHAHQADAGTDLIFHADPLGNSTPPIHAFPLLRADHLAVLALDLDAKTQYWTASLGVPVLGEVRTSTHVIRQLRMGDVVLELLGAAGLDSPLHQRPPGPSSLVSWEVADVQAAAEQARAAGFTVPKPAPGLLPGTIITTIPAVELAGVAMQLLQYVRS